MPESWRVNGADIRIGTGCRIAFDGVTVKGRGTLVIGDYVTIEPNVLIDLSGSGHGAIRLGNRVKIKYGCVLRTYNGSITVGNRTSIGEHTVIFGHGGVTIGEDCGFGPHCSIHPAGHIVQGALPIRFQGETAHGIRIDAGVWLGAGVRVLDGVVIGEGAAIGANAVVNRDIPAFEVHAGVPSRKVGNTTSGPFSTGASK